MKRKILWCWLSLLLVAALVLASCGPAAVEKKAEKEGPQYGGTITHYLWGGEAANADQTLSLWPTQMYASPVIEFLMVGDFVKYGPRGTGEFGFLLEGRTPENFLKGAIAESWEVSPNKIIFHIRQGVYWAAEGKEHVMERRELTADDVAFSINRYLDSVGAGHGFHRTENGGWIDSIYAEGNTVVVETSSYNADWLWVIGLGWANAIHAPEVVDAGASDWDNLVGTGPFMVKEYVIGSHISYERNPDYWDKTTINGIEYEIPFIDELVYPIIPDESTRIAALRTGKLDVDYAVPALYEETLAQTSPEMLKNKRPHGSFYWASLRCDRGPTSNKKVRQALMIAIDPKPIVTAVFGEGQTSGWPAHTALTGIYTPPEELPAETRLLLDYNPDLARQMLADAGYPDGFAIEIATRGGVSDLNFVDCASMVAAYWTEIGLDVTVRPMELTAYWSYLTAGKLDSALEVSGTINLLSVWREILLPGARKNPAFYDNPYLIERFLEAEQTIDTAKRNAILKELAVIVLDDVPFVPIGSQILITYWWPWIKNYYGEFESSYYGFGYLMAHAWLDQALKAQMGH